MSVNRYTTVTVTAYNDYGSTTRTVPFTQGTMPSFRSASISAGPVTGSNYRISWTTSNASSITVSGVSGTYGANTSTLTSTQTAGTRTHTLTARNNASGCTATRNVSTYVNRATYTVRSYPYTNPQMNPSSDSRPGCLSGALCHNQYRNTTSSFGGRYSEMPSKRLRITAGHAKSASNYVETRHYPRHWLWTTHHHTQGALVKLTGLSYGGQQWRSYVDIPASQTSSWRQMRYELIWKVDWNPFGRDHGFHVDMAFRFNGNSLQVRTTNQQMYLNTWNNHAGAAFRVDIRVMP